MAELTPIAIASVSTATMVNPGVLSSCRKANLKSWSITMNVVFSEMQSVPVLDSKLLRVAK
jgi:hypothetical protein